MTSRQFIDFIEAKLIEHGVRKVLPELSTIEVHARRLIEQHLARAALASIRHQVAADAANYVLPDLEARLEACREQNPELPWDDALGQLIAQTLG